MKLFSKIATAFVGIAMAIGVGVAVSSTKVGEVRADSTANFTLSSASDVTVDGVTASFGKSSGSNAPAWYAAGLRLYGNNTVTISSSNTLTGVSFNWEKQGSKAFATATANVGSYTHPSAAGTGTWTGSSTSVVFTLGSSGQLQLNTFSVTYSGGGTTTYTVTYNANEHGTGTMTDPNSPYTSGAEVTVLTNTFVADTDYEFVDFNTAADGSGTSYDAGDKFEISANTTLYAQWNYTGVGPDVSLVASSTSDFVSPWSVDNTPSGIEAANRGWQWSGGTSAVITYSTDKSVSRVVVSATTNGSGSLAVTVGGNDFGESTAITSTKTAYTFEGNETGDVVITLTNSGTKSVYADRIEIYFNNLIETKMVDNHNYTITTYQFYDGDPTLVFKYFDNNDQAIDNANWVTSDSSVLKLNPKTSYAYIGPNGLGTATVTASKEGYKPATVTFTVVPNPSQQTLTVYEYDGSSATNPADDTTVLWSSGTGTYRYVAIDEDNNIITTASWTSSDPTVATVTSSEGVASVTTVKPGEYSLTATSSGFNSGSADITVSKSYVENVVVGGSMTKTTYTTSESWSSDGLTATADYHSGWFEDVTSEVEWTFSPASPTAGTTSVIPYAHFEGEAYAGSSQSVTVTRINGIEQLYSKAKGATTGEFYGYYVGFATGSGPILMDGAYGIMLFNSSQDVSSWTENETIIHVQSGTIDIYNGLYEVKSYTLETVSSADVATPIVHTTTGSETATDANRLTNATGKVAASPTKGNFTDPAGTSDIQFTYTVGSNTFSVFYKKAAQTDEVIAVLKDSLDNSTEITIKGFTSWYNNFQVTMTGIVEAVVTYTAEDFSQDLLDQTDAVCEDYDGKTNNHDAIEAIWSNLASNDKYPSLPSDQKTILAEAARNPSGTVIEQAMARYDYLTGKYNLSNFINGRTPVVFAAPSSVSSDNNINSSMSIIVVAVIAITSLSAIGVLLVIKRRKSI